MGHKKKGKKKGKVQHTGFFRRNIFYWIGLVVLFFCVYKFCAFVEEYSTDSDSYVSDGENVEYAGIDGNFYAIDESGVLSADTISYIEEQGKALCDATKAQIVVDIVPDTGDSSLFDYSMDLFKENGYGDEQLDNGLLLLITTTEIHARITTGYGLEGCLPDGKCGRILDTYTMDALNSGDYDKAVRDTWNSLATVVYQEYGLTAPDEVYDNAIAADTEETDTADEESIDDEGAISSLMESSIFVWLCMAAFLTFARFLFREESQINPYKGWVGRWLSSSGDGDSCGGSSGGGGGGGGGSSGGGGAER